VTRTIVCLLIAGLGLASCVPPEVSERLAALETKVEALDDKVTKAAANAPSAPARPPNAASEEDEKKATELLKAATQEAEKRDYDAAKKTLASLKKDFPTTRAARAATRLETELAVIGKDVGDMKVEKWHGGKLTGYDGAKAHLLVFWEVWCPHCKREMPKIGEKYGDWKSKGLEVVGLTKQSRNITDEQVVEFIKSNKITFPMGKEVGDEMSKEFGVRGVPAAAVVKDGKVVWRGHPSRITEDMVNSWL
jgi:peroxiredoxin